MISAGSGAVDLHNGTHLLMRGASVGINKEERSVK